MRASTSFLVTIAVVFPSATLALPQYINSLGAGNVGPLNKRATGGSFTDWVAPTATDARGPCPGLNTLANHGFLPHDGKSITVDMMVAAVDEGYNAGPLTAQLPGKLALSSNVPKGQQWFNLNDLNIHNTQEHDASLSREDYGTSADHDNHDFNQTMFDVFLSKVPEGQDFLDLQSAAAGRRERILMSKANNPQFEFTLKHALISFLETSLVLQVMGSPATLQAPLKYVNVWFKEERLPYAEGWRRGSVQTSLPSSLATVLKLHNAVPIPEIGEQDMIITLSTIQNAFQK